MTKRPDETDVWVGVRVRLRRQELGLSQTEVGHRLGITFQQIQKYEKGTNRIGAGRLRALAETLSVPINYFFTEPANSTGSTATTAEVLDLLSIPGAVQMLRDYARITNPATRRATRSLLESLARTPGQNGQADSPLRLA